MVIAGIALLECWLSGRAIVNLGDRLEELGIVDATARHPGDHAPSFAWFLWRLDRRAAGSCWPRASVWIMLVVERRFAVFWCCAAISFAVDSSIWMNGR